jgi:hypothetical protein
MFSETDLFKSPCSYATSPFCLVEVSGLEQARQLLAFVGYTKGNGHNTHAE